MMHRETIYRLMGASFLTDISKHITFNVNRSRRRISFLSETLNCYLKRSSKFSQFKASEDGADVIFDKFSDDGVDRRKLAIKF